MTTSFQRLAAEIRACRVCIDSPKGEALPHEPRPVFQGLPSVRMMLAGQAPGTKVHASGRPYTDASGDRLREWLGLDEAHFYDEKRVSIMPMGFCFPGQDTKGGDLPPRRECALTWHDRLLAHFHNVELLVLIGQYAQRYHFRRLGLEAHLRDSLQATVENWRHAYEASSKPRLIPIPHPSWRNTGWLKRNPWFSTELLPVLQDEVKRVMAG